MASDNGSRSPASTVTDYSHTAESPLHLEGSELLERCSAGRTTTTPEGPNHILLFGHNAMLGQAINDADEAPPPWDNQGDDDTSEDGSGSDGAAAPPEIQGTIGSIYVVPRLGASSVPAAPPPFL